MGNSSSAAAPTDATNNDIDRFDGIQTLGYRVLGVQPNSPASQAGLVSFLDFIVGAEGKPLFDSGEDLQEGEEYNDIDFPTLLQEFKGKELELVVWNIKSQQQRWVTIVPSDTWGGAGLLGVTIRLDDYAQAEERLIHVLEVEHQSPAQIAGLVEYQDYLLGTTTETLDSTETLSKILHAHIDRVVELYVYNCESDIVRVVALMPTWSWGGKGLLGAQVATGYLHRLPSSTQDTCGTSLERKVRWVGLATAAAAAGSSAPQQQQSSTANANGNGMPTLEMEPQLEMEPADDDPPDETIFQQQQKQQQQQQVESNDAVQSPHALFPTTNYQNGGGASGITTTAARSASLPTSYNGSNYGTAMNAAAVAAATVAAADSHRYVMPPPPYAFAHGKERAKSEGAIVLAAADNHDGTSTVVTTQAFVSADTAAAAAAVKAHPSTSLSPTSSSSSPKLAAAATTTTTTPSPSTAPLASSSTPAEELFMGPPPVTPPNRRAAKRIQEPVKDPSIQVFVPPPLLSSPYWSQVATNKKGHGSGGTSKMSSTNRTRALSSDSLDLR